MEGTSSTFHLVKSPGSTGGAGGGGPGASSTSAAYCACTIGGPAAAGLAVVGPSSTRVRFVRFFVQQHDICAKHWRYFDCFDLRRFEPLIPILNYSFDRNIVILWCHARSVLLDTGLPGLLPLDIIWLLRPQEGFNDPDFFFLTLSCQCRCRAGRIFRACCRKNWGFGHVVQVIPGK
jgi:hypothetical protein